MNNPPIGLELIQYEFISPRGVMYLVASDRGLHRVFWHRLHSVSLLDYPSGKTLKEKIISKARQELIEFFDSKRESFELPLDVAGTAFQKKVWSELLKIPYGETRSYLDIAQSVGTKGVRAVGSAIRQNPCCLIIPCHRVILSSGKVGHYSGGADLKQELLMLESSFKNKIMSGPVTPAD